MTARTTSCGLMQADAYSGYNGLYVAGRERGLIVEAACWAHGRRKLFELAELQKGKTLCPSSPLRRLALDASREGYPGVPGPILNARRASRGEA